MGNLWNDLRYGTRMFSKNPGFASIAVLTLALGIGANTTIFSLTDALILRPFDFPQQRRLVMVWELLPGFDHGLAAPGNFNDWRSENQSLEQLAAFQRRSFDLTGADQPERYDGYAVSPGFFDTLGVKAALGRAFLPGEDEPGRDRVVVLKHGMWQRRFGSDPNVVGKTLTLNGGAFTIIGVMPAGFSFPFNAGDLWSPLSLDEKAKRERGQHSLQVVGRLKSGVSVAQAGMDLDNISRRAQQRFPETNAGLSANVVGMNEDFSRDSLKYLSVLIGAGAFVLLIACANIANLLLSYALGREKEIAVRLALGASRRRLIRQMLTESLLLALASGVIGLFLSVWAVELLRNSMPQEFAKFIPGFDHLGVNRAALLFTVLVSMLTNLLFGALPAWQASKPNIDGALKEGMTRGASVGSHRRFGGALIVVEMALALMLLIGAGLMVRSFVTMLRDDLGFDPRNVLGFQLELSKARRLGAKRGDFYERLVKRLEALPGVEAAGAIDALPLSGGGAYTTFEVVGQAPLEENEKPIVNIRIVTPGYFKAVGVPLRRGRDFNDGDTEQAPDVVIIDETSARRFFPDQEVIGQQIKHSGQTKRPSKIVGVVSDMKNNDIDQISLPTLYLVHAQYPQSGMGIAMRATTKPILMAAAARREVMNLDPNQPIFNLKTIEQLIHERTSPKRIMTAMMAALAGIALLLGAAGIYAIMAYTVSQRTYEIGVRMALGAEPRSIFWLITKQGLKLTLVGLGLGYLGALALTRAMSPILYGVTPNDPLTFVMVSSLLAGTALLACWIPSRRAAKVDPMIALRGE
jgi:putative ABC transport system permease protein